MLYKKIKKNTAKKYALRNFHFRWLIYLHSARPFYELGFDIPLHDNFTTGYNKSSTNSDKTIY